MKNIIPMTTDGAYVVKKAGKICGLMHQLCLAHGIQLAVNKVLYRKTTSNTSHYEEEIINFYNDMKEEDYSPGVGIDFGVRNRL